MKHHFIAEQSGQSKRFGVRWLCSLLNVSHGGYNGHRRRVKTGQTERQRQRAALAREVLLEFQAGKGRVGARTIMHKLARRGVLAPHGKSAGIYLVRKLMREQNLVCFGLGFDRRLIFAGFRFGGWWGVGCCRGGLGVGVLFLVVE